MGIVLLGIMPLWKAQSFDPIGALTGLITLWMANFICATDVQHVLNLRLFFCPYKARMKEGYIRWPKASLDPQEMTPKDVPR